MKTLILALTLTLLLSCGKPQPAGNSPTSNHIVLWNSAERQHLIAMAIADCNSGGTVLIFEGQGPAVCMTEEAYYVQHAPKIRVYVPEELR